VSAAPVDRTAYDVFVGLHVASAIVGFGAVALSGVYGGNARHAQRVEARDEALEELRRYFASPGWMELLVVAVPFFGAAALVVGPRSEGVGQAWVLAGLGLWSLATLLLLAVVRPAEERLGRAVAAVVRSAASGEAAGGDQAAGSRLRSAGVTLQWAAAAMDLIFLVALVVMVIKPGS
jgi:hypothetical protein